MWFSQPSPALVGSDIVYPMHYFDEAMPDTIVAVTLRFDDVLDPEMIRDSLIRLYEIGDWRKLGGRLRKNASGKFEIHSPIAFTRERPAVGYSHESLDMAVKDHPLGAQLPQAGEDPKLYPRTEVFRLFAASPTAPACHADYLRGDFPLTSLQITSFKDATLVGYAWPHTLFDALGLQTVLKHWTLVMAGKEGQVPPLSGAWDDILHEAADPAVPAPEELIDQDSILKGFRMALFGGQMALSMITQKSEARTIFLPKSAFGTLRADAVQHLRTASGQSEAFKPPFLSDHDILMGWITNIIITSQSKPTPANIMTIVNYKSRLPSIRPLAEGTFVQNIVTGITVPISADQATGPFGLIARQHRECLAAQTTEPQLKAQLQMRRVEGDAGRSRDAVRVQDITGPLIICTNWTKADCWNAVDFAPAVVRSSSKDGHNSLYPPGSLVYQHTQALKSAVDPRNLLQVAGKDREGNYWITAYLGIGAWKKVEAELERFGGEGLLANSG